MIDFAKLAGMKRTAVVGLRGEWTTVEKEAAKTDADGKEVPAVTEPVFTGILVTVRALTAEETLTVQNTFDKPKPGYRKSEFAGSAAPDVPDMFDARYEKGMREYKDNLNAAAAAIATGHHVGGVPYEKLQPSERPAWIRTAAAELRVQLADGEIDGIVDASLGLGQVSRGVEAALKN